MLVWVLAGLREQVHRALERTDLPTNRALTDPLTGPTNRNAAQERSAAEPAGAQRSGWPLSVLRLDLDHLKRIRDRHGFDARDQVLVAVSAAIRAQLRTGDLLARWGGEELVALMQRADPALERGKPSDRDRVVPAHTGEVAADGVSRFQRHRRPPHPALRP